MRARGARPMVCGSPRAAAVLASQVARHAIADWRAGQTGADGRDRGPQVPCGVPMTLWGCVPCLEYMLGQCLSA